MAPKDIVVRLCDALKPFADSYRCILERGGRHASGAPIEDTDDIPVLWGDMRRAHDALALVGAHDARPASEWHEDFGPVLWWKFPIEEAPYVGTPLDTPVNVKATLEINGKIVHGFQRLAGGWPGHHTHWTPLPRLPMLPEGALVKLTGRYGWMTDAGKLAIGEDDIGTVVDRYADKQCYEIEWKKHPGITVTVPAHIVTAFA